MKPNLLVGSVTLRGLQKISVMRAQQWHKDKPWDANKWVTATIGEFGEFCNELKKCNRDEDGLDSNNHRRVDLGKELADTLCYLVLLADSVGVDMETETVKCFNAISRREGFDLFIGDSVGGERQ